MPISDLPILSMLRAKMQWHQERQQVLADNVANSDTPEFQPHDLVPLDLSRSSEQLSPVMLARTEPGHLAASGETAPFASSPRGYQIRPTGNAVSLEDEMMKVAANQMDYQTVTTLYSHSLNLIKTAVGKS